MSKREENVGRVSWWGNLQLSSLFHQRTTVNTIYYNTYDHIGSIKMTKYRPKQKKAAWIYKTSKPETQLVLLSPPYTNGKCAIIRTWRIRSMILCELVTNHNTKRMLDFYQKSCQTHPSPSPWSWRSIRFYKKDVLGLAVYGWRTM